MGSLVQEREHHTGGSPGEGHQDDHTTSEEKLGQVGLFSLEDDAPTTFHYLQGHYREDRARSFLEVHSKRAGNNSQQEEFSLDEKNPHFHKKGS